jgi:hypothetical protein
MKGRIQVSCRRQFERAGVLPSTQLTVTSDTSETSDTSLMLLA